MKRIVDLHCDTVSTAMARGIDFKNESLNINIYNGKDLEKWYQVFAFWTSDKYEGKDGFECFVAQKEWFLKNFDNSTNCTPIMAVEGGNIFGGDISRIEKLLDMFYITLTWSYDNELSGSSGGSGSGLTAFGKEVVRQMNKHNILVDVSHLSDAGFKDLCSLTDYPFIASHSNCRSITNNPRNLTDDQIKEFIAREGLIGLNFYDAFVGKDKNDLKKHIDHFLELGAETVLCMGSDFDGADIIYDIANFDGFYGLYDDMINWYGENITENIFYNNAKRFIKI